jgi:hypothetical protein
LARARPPLVPEDAHHPKGHFPRVKPSTSDGMELEAPAGALVVRPLVGEDLRVGSPVQGPGEFPPQLPGHQGAEELAVDHDRELGERCLQPLVVTLRLEGELQAGAEDRVEEAYRAELRVREVHDEIAQATFVTVQVLEQRDDGAVERRTGGRKREPLSPRFGTSGPKITLSRPPDERRSRTCTKLCTSYPVKIPPHLLLVAKRWPSRGSWSAVRTDRLGSTRMRSLRYLREPCVLDRRSMLFRRLRDLWHADETAQPILALLCSLTPTHSCARRPVPSWTSRLGGRSMPEWRPPWPSDIRLCDGDARLGCLR